MNYGKRTKAELDGMTDAELYDAVERGSLVDPDVIAYLKAHRAHVLFDRLLDHKNGGGTIGGPAQAQSATEPTRPPDREK